MTLIPYPQDSAAPTPWSGIRRFSLIGAVLVAVFVVGFGIWAAVAPLGSAVLASGVVAPETRRKTIQHLEGGIISAILVRDGQEVVAGTPLIRLDPTRARATVMGLEGQLWDALAQQARLMAERDGREDIAFPDTLAARAGDPAVAGAIQGQERVFETRRNLRRS
ncbi:MAG TPA: biotin/lipoyl-binding protein, partial [Azospirillaceae bacterium]|nr:biotin/lipoyl-binding protein [Azospirillaceae bacterium]